MSRVVSIADVLKREGEQSVEIPWHGKRNLTGMMAMAKADPELRQIVDEGIEIEKAWLADELQSARDMERIAAQERRKSSKSWARNEPTSRTKMNLPLPIQLPNESPQALRAFAFYVKLGDKRSIKAVARRCHKNASLCGRRNSG